MGAQNYIFVPYVVRDVYDETGKVVIVTFYVWTEDTLFLEVFLLHCTNTFKKHKILTPATHTQYYITHKMFDSF